MDPLQPFEASQVHCSVASALCVDENSSDRSSDSIGMIHARPRQTNDAQRGLGWSTRSPSSGSRLKKVTQEMESDERMDTMQRCDSNGHSSSGGYSALTAACGNIAKLASFSNGNLSDGADGTDTQSFRPSSMEADPTDITYDPRYMIMALQIGKQAMENHAEVPVGCILVQRYTGFIIGQGANRCNELRNATKHAELVSLADVQSRYPNAEARGALLANCDVYVTCEPCIMCTAALITNGIGGYIYFGCRNERFGGCGTVLCVHDGSCGLPLCRNPLRVSGGHFARESIALLHRFYEMENMFAPEEKRKVKRPRMKGQANLISTSPEMRDGRQHPTKPTESLLDWEREHPRCLFR
ncbi:hypothetical protein F1559_002931 [Cyanidiococcus yangmingshanensis]|uniref:CMP/dCMP-type deaminase domain-containing protein n=1 Tax=Cyanidiococcus yangmingshanensis TaxID=2690220 RepID=A0A7J7IJM2_9RHOD|nr:hypothetical protein F1559_002931 [Cyanidiococcus yangmingshanensis]